MKQENIPVGCVPPTALAAIRCDRDLPDRDTPTSSTKIPDKDPLWKEHRTRDRDRK